ncbi:hypothetical protein BKA62DRAFT_648362, partial [Auriculariales sp. MPI-PUGE-AT-0066]
MPDINRVPSGESNLNDNSRQVYIASRFIYGPYTQYAIQAGKFIAGGPVNAVLDYFRVDDELPNPCYHWCVVVGDFYHQLQSDENDKCYYENQRLHWIDCWNWTKVSTTKFNDVAIVAAATKVIRAMPKEYHLLTNNCQHFTLNLLDLICRDGRRKVYTLENPLTLKAAYVPGADDSKEADQEQEVEIAFVVNDEAHLDMKLEAEKFMNEKTPMATLEDI